MEGDTKHLIRRGIHLARADYRMRDMADAIGCSPQHLSTFLRGGPFGAEFTQAAEQWLRDVGYWEMPTPTGLPPEHLIASRLRALADYLESPSFPIKAKITEFSASIKSFYDSLDSIVTAMDKCHND